MAIESVISFFPGDHVIQPFTVRNPDGSGAPLDITGWPVRFTLRENADDEAALITKTVGSGITLTNPGNGEGELVLTSSDTQALTFGVKQWQIDRTTGGAETKLGYGPCVILRPGP